jgi:hypothetical protein
MYMKKLFLLSLGLGLFLSVLAQTQRTVTIDVTGNRNKQTAVDGNTYAVTNSLNTDQQTITINGLANGQHTLVLYRTVNNRTSSSSSTFSLREGFDLTIAINSNGAITLSESRTGSGDIGGRAISTQAFNRLYTAAKNKIGSTARTRYLQDEFAKANRRFTSAQASQLIQLVNSESRRLTLAKAVYTKITDPANFSKVSSLLNSTASRNELNEYVNNSTYAATDIGSPLDDTRFNQIYREVTDEPTQSDRNYYLVNFFGKTTNFYSSSQARRLMQLITSESQRLHLAKMALRGVTDRDNYYSEMYTILNSTSSRNELNTYIATYNSNNNTTTTGTAMSATQFSQLYQSVYSRNTTTSRYNDLNTAFNTAGYYFTATQAKQLIQLISDETNRLTLAKMAYRVLVDKANYTQLNELFYSQANRDALAAYVQYYGGGTGTVGTGTVMSETEFRTLYNNVNTSWSASTRYSMLNDAFRNQQYYFSSDHVRQLLLLSSNESERLALAKLAFDNVVDVSNFTTVYSVFASAANRNELARFINDPQYGAATTRVAMSDADFRAMYRDVQYTFGLGAKMSELTKIFNNDVNSFTVQQARQLIQLVSSESNRVELAKLSYNNLTDPTNFSQLYDIFSSQSSKDELTAYVNSVIVQ